MSDGSLESIEILGVSIFDHPPIGTLHLELDAGLHVLYGRNGVGKTRTLEAVRGGLINHWEHDSSVWVHLRVVDDAMPGRLTTTEWFRESLFFQLSDSLVRTLHFSDPTVEPPVGLSQMSLERLWELLPLSGEPDVPDSIQGLVVANAWIEGLDDTVVAVREILDRCYLSVEVGRGPSRVFLSSMGQTTPTLNLLGQLNVALHKDSPGDVWDRPTARAFKPQLREWDPDSPEIVDLISGLKAMLPALEGSTAESALTGFLRASFSLEPQFAFFHEARPEWVPTPLMLLSGGIEAPVTVVWDDRQRIDAGELARITLETLTARSDKPTFREVEVDGSVGVVPSKDLPSRLAGLGDAASRRFEGLLQEAPPIEPTLLSTDEWISGEILRWHALDRDTSEFIGLDSLSEAQARWANVAIRQTLSQNDRAPSHLLMDEPEQALHPTAVKHLARGLSNLARDSGVLVLVASHAPAMLSTPEASLLHVDRDPHGEVVTNVMAPGAVALLAETAASLGLAPSDLLQLTRVFLYVEGPHDRAVLEQWFGEDLGSSGVTIMTLGGTRNLATITDSRLLFDYTDAQIMIVLDNINGPRFEKLWETAKQASLNHNLQDAHDILSKAPRGGKEWDAYLKFAHAAVDHGRVDRLHLRGISEPDIIYYLPSDYFVPGSSWEDLQEPYKKTRVKRPDGGHENIKEWLRRQHRIHVGVRQFVKAAKLAPPPKEISRLADFAISLSRGSEYHTRVD